MTQPQVIKSITLIVVLSFVIAWLGQSLVYHFHIADAICLTNDCPGETKGTIITTSFIIAVFCSIYFIFMHPVLGRSPGIELSILLCCLIVNFIQFNNANAYLCLIPYNVLMVYFYYRVKKQMGRPFKLFPFIVQELFLLLILLATYIYLDWLFVSKGLDREVVMETGAEKLMGHIISTIVWITFFTHLGWVALTLVKRRSVVRKVIMKS